MLKTLIVLGLLTNVLFADELKLKDGRSLDGALMSRDADRIVFMRSWGVLRIAVSQVEAVVPSPHPVVSWRERHEALDAQDLEGRMSLAQWCEDEKLPGPMKLEAQAIVDLDPDCEDARAMLGQVSVDGRWMREAAAKSARGEVKIGGVWYPAAEAERRLASRRRARALASLERRINRRLQDLFSSSETASRKAHDQLMSIAREERLGELADLTSRWYDQAQTWRSQGGGTIIEVRAERAQITAMRERSLSLGGGAGSVRVQLPELRRTRVATTVVF